MEHKRPALIAAVKEIFFTSEVSLEFIGAGRLIEIAAKPQMIPVTISVDVSDACDANPTCKITTVFSDEAVGGTGDGDTSPDWVITGDLTLDLRAERSGQGGGRVYTITIECTDVAGNPSTRDLTVTVPPDQDKGGSKKK